MAFSYDYMPRAGQKAADTPAGKVTNHGTTASAGEFDIPNTNKCGTETLSVAHLSVRPLLLANQGSTVVELRSPEEIAYDSSLRDDPYAENYLRPPYEAVLAKHFGKNQVTHLPLKNASLDDKKCTTALVVKGHGLHAVAKVLEQEYLAPAGFAQAVATAAQASEEAHKGREAAKPAPRSRV